VDPTFPCKIDRIAGPLADVEHMCVSRFSVPALFTDADADADAGT
jgi:hypothetical protein